MKRRRNFLFGGATKYEVNVYHYGKSYARGGRNVNTRQFSSVKAATDWAKINLDYPEVEVVDMSTGRVIFSGGTGKVGNPRKRKAPRRRDAYAEMAKARKTTKGHKRKDRKRAVARGSSRKPKHKRRYNPPADHEQSTAETKIKNIFRRWSQKLAAQGVPQDMLPNLFDKDVKEQITQSARVLVASQHPELRSEAMESTPGVEVAQYVLQLKPGGAFQKFQKKYGDVFTEQTMEVAELVEQGRKGVAKAQTATKRKVRKATKDAATAKEKKEAARIKKLQAEAAKLQGELSEDEDMPADVAAELAEEFGDTQRELALAEAPEPDEEEYEPAGFLREKRPSSQKRSDRLGRYADFLTPVRSSIRAPLDALAKTREDVLLYRLKDGTTQVYMKGALTVAFEPSAKLSSETIAHRYANRWRGLKPSGAVSPEAKKRRLATAVYLGVEGKSSVKLIEKPIALVKKGDRKADRKKYPMPDLDSYELKGDRANPRRRKNVGNLKGVISDKSFQIMIDGPVDRKYAVKIWDLKKDEPAYDGDWVHSSYQAARNYALRWLKMAPAKRPTWNPKRRKNAECKVNGCHRKARSKGLCGPHTSRDSGWTGSDYAGWYLKSTRPSLFEVVGYRVPGTPVPVWNVNWVWEEYGAGTRVFSNVKSVREAKAKASAFAKSVKGMSKQAIYETLRGA